MTGERMDIRLRPVSGMVRDDSVPSGWCSGGAGSRFVLEPPDGGWPSGWVLLDAVCVCHSAQRSARLDLIIGPGLEKVMLDVPVTHKGVIHELVFLPEHLHGIEWLPLQGRGDLVQSGFTLCRVGPFARLFHMWRRVLPMLWRRPARKLEAAGLGWVRAMRDLRGAYAAAGRLLAFTAPLSYPDWVAVHDTLSGADRTAITRHLARLADPPRFELLLDASAGDADALARTMQSLARQLYAGSSVCVINGKGWDGYVAGDHVDRYLLLLRAGDELAEHALYWLACAAVRTPGAALIYSDEDRLDEEGRRSAPCFKPDWSPELMRSTNYIGQLAAMRSDVLMRSGGIRPSDLFGDNHGLLLRVTEGLPAGRIVHVPAVLVHRPGQAVVHDGADAVRGHLARCSVEGSVEQLSPGRYRIRYALPQHPPLVSIIIPTRDGLSLLRRCIDSILQKSSYRSIEVIVVDNQSSDRDALAYLAELQERGHASVLRHDAPFNYPAINNLAARHARGEVLCLLNNDTEVISPDWLEEMLGHLLQDKVGAVGAKLYYPDGRIQHAGDLVGVGGVANHAHAWLQRGESGYCDRAMLAQEFSAVTAACLLTWRRLYLDLGGLDEEHLPVAFNDVDYCLRVREAGYRVVWTPHAALYHYESVSRGKDLTPEKKRRAKREVSYMRKRWKRVLADDPYYNPNLSHERADFSLSHAPVVDKPWQE